MPPSDEHNYAHLPIMDVMDVSDNDDPDYEPDDSSSDEEGCKKVLVMLLSQYHLL